MQHVPTRLRNLCLKIRDSEDQELVYSKGAGWWVGLEKVFAPDAFGLIRLCLISSDSFSDHEKYQVWTLTTDGIKLCDDPEHKPEILNHTGSAKLQNNS